LQAIAESFGAELASINEAAQHQSSEKAATAAERLLDLAPWHLRLLVMTVEILASLWCVIYRLGHAGRRNPAEEIATFEKFPLISAPLLKLYRSLVALSWFELPEVSSSLGLHETREQRQQRFRLERSALL